jgi:cyclic dehypoxanthinyl futalosine synthase
MQLNNLYTKALNKEFLSIEEGAFLFNHAPLEELMHVGHQLRQQHVPGNTVTWMIDRNVNITNACVARCKFCNFHRVPGHDEVYITSLEQYREKIESMMALGGYQLLLQGGLHPKLGLQYYKDLFSSLKSMYPMVRLHALGPAEVTHIAKLEKMTVGEVLKELVASGMDSLPGAGAEILADRVRKAISPGKCSTDEWLSVMREAHKLNLVTSATMMFGHIETIEERMEHFVRVRELQAEKPAGTYGFTAFISWPFQDEDTEKAMK